MAPFDLKFCSSFINWTIKPRLGLTFLVCLICLRVFTRDHFLFIIKAAASIVADRLRPTRQLMTTRPPGAARALEMKSAAGWKYGEMLAAETSSTWNWNISTPRLVSFSPGSQTSLVAVLMMWVTPSSLMYWTFFTVFPLARMRRGITSSQSNPTSSLWARERGWVRPGNGLETSQQTVKISSRTSPAASYWYHTIKFSNWYKEK